MVDEEQVKQFIATTQLELQAADRRAIWLGVMGFLLGVIFTLVFC